MLQKSKIERSANQSTFMFAVQTMCTAIPTAQKEEEKKTDKERKEVRKLWQNAQN